MNSTEYLSMFLQLLAPAFLDMLGLAAFGMAVAVFACELAGKTRSMVFFDKYAQQGATLGLWLLGIGLLSGGAGVFILGSRFPELIQGFLRNMNLTVAAAVSAALFVLTFTPYVLAWKKMRTSKGAHLALGALSMLAALALIALSIMLFLILAGYGATQDAVAALASLPTHGTSLLWPLTALTLFLAVAHATGLSAPYLALRRTKDDFGRDYYTFAMKTASTRALSAMVLLLACTGWLLAVLPVEFREIMFTTSLWMAWAGVGTCGLLCAVIWSVLAANSHPMRLKGLAFVATGLLWMLHTFLATILINLFLMI